MHKRDVLSVLQMAVDICTQQPMGWDSLWFGPSHYVCLFIYEARTVYEPEFMFIWLQTLSGQDRGENSVWD